MKFGIKAKFNVIFICIAFISVMCFGVLYYTSSKNVSTMIGDRSDLFDKIMELQHKTLAGFADLNAWWDDMVVAVDKKDTAWFDDTATVSIENFYADTVWIYNAQGELVYTNTVIEDQDVQEVVKKNYLPKEEVQRLVRTHEDGQFFVNTEKGLIEAHGVMVSMSTDNSERKKDGNGIFFTGRLWNEEYISMIENLTETKISIESPISADSEIENGFVKNAVSYDGKPVASIVVHDVSKGLQQAEKSNTQLGIFLAGYALAIWIVLATMLSKWVVKPMQKMATLLRNETRKLEEISDSISSDSHSLSEAASEQANSVDQTTMLAKNLEETSVNNSKNALVTANKIEQLQQTSMQGGHTVSKMTDAIDRVKATTAEAVDIITVINSIAFQTNLLALNAAVEAARAGEMGKGFAVVADEVRNLAQRSSQAASETTEKLTKAREESEKSGVVASEMISVFTEIEKQTVEAVQMISEISELSTQQTNDLDKVNNAIHGIGDIAKRNHGYANQSAQAGQSLLDGTEQLVELAGTFNELVYGEKDRS